MKTKETTIVVGGYKRQPAATRSKSYNGLALGSIVSCHGYCMRVTELCAWDTTMIVCGHGGGTVCVGAKSVRKLSAQECCAYDLGDRIV